MSQDSRAAAAATAALPEKLEHAALVRERLCDPSRGRRGKGLPTHVGRRHRGVDPGGDALLDHAHAAGQLEQENAEAPHVGSEAIVPAVANLGGDEREGAYLELAVAARELHCRRVEVDELDVDLAVGRLGEDHALGLDAPVADVGPPVEVVHDGGQLGDQRALLVRVDALGAPNLQPVEQALRAGEFHADVEACRSVVHLKAAGDARVGPSPAQRLRQLPCTVNPTESVHRAGHGRLRDHLHHLAAGDDRRPRRRLELVHELVNAKWQLVVHHVPGELLCSEVAQAIIDLRQPDQQSLWQVLPHRALHLFLQRALILGSNQPVLELFGPLVRPRLGPRDEGAQGEREGEAVRFVEHDVVEGAFACLRQLRQGRRL
mmetsp:Transcript_27261/g.78448  ORF Transcript_27261/g.78448 Transcript_27261/m.78448 type:complete len:376 (-) Transcript_27261:398-1525(-)